MCTRDRVTLLLFLINDAIPNHSVQTLFVYYRSSNFQLTSWEGAGTDLEVDDRAGKLNHLSQSASLISSRQDQLLHERKLTPKCPRVFIILYLSPPLNLLWKVTWPNSWCELRTTSHLRTCLHLFPRDPRFGLGRSALIDLPRKDWGFRFSDAGSLHRSTRHAPFLYGRLCTSASVLLSSRSRSVCPRESPLSGWQFSMYSIPVLFFFN
jgi:hypothetical protein